MPEIWKISLKKKLTEIYVQNPDQEWVDLDISTTGLVNLRIASKVFNGLSYHQRQEKLMQELESYLGSFQVDPGSIFLYTLEEARSMSLSRPWFFDENSIHTWQDLALSAANPQNQPEPLPLKTGTPPTVTFYSFKGGVGQTTALIHVAWILAMRGLKVVAVDLDLEAPGLSTAFSLKPQPKFGLVDYFYERSYGPGYYGPKDDESFNRYRSQGSEEIETHILITDIFGEVKIPEDPGRLFIVSAGSLNLDYIAQVDDLRATTITDHGETLWTLFRREIQEQLKPDLILVDSSTGLNEWGALSLLEAADQAMIFLFPNEQNRLGTELLLSSLNSVSKLSINYVFSPIPDLGAIGMAKVKDIWPVLPRNKGSGNEEHYSSEIGEPLIIPYLESIALADRYPVTSSLDYYTKIADVIEENNHFCPAT